MEDVELQSAIMRSLDKLEASYKRTWKTYAESSRQRWVVFGMSMSGRSIVC